jgi:hypothetical protein
MAPPAKRIKLEKDDGGFQMFRHLPETVIKKIFGYVRQSSLPRYQKCRSCKQTFLRNNLRLNEEQDLRVRSQSKKSAFKLRKINNAHITLQLQPDTLQPLLHTKRKFDEIFFYGNQSPQDVSAILNQFGQQLRIIKFAKNDLKFIKISWDDLVDFLSVAPNVTELDLTSIEIKNVVKTESVSVMFENLKKLKCYDTALYQITAPVLERVEIQVIEGLSDDILQCINNFVQINQNIVHFTLRVFCDDDPEIQSVPLKLSHLHLHTLALREFRFDPEDVAKILSEQKDLVKLHLEDGSLTNEDCAYSRQLIPVFEEILGMKKLDKLVIELPTVAFLMMLLIMPNLKRLSITNIAQRDLRLLGSVKNSHLEKLCIENIEFGKEAMEESDVHVMRGLLRGLTTLKIDTTPLNVMKVLLTELEKLKTLKVIRNQQIAKKFKQMRGENVELPTTNLEKIICDSEDFKLRILPIIKVSPRLAHVKMYWDNKNTSFIGIAFSIIRACHNIKIIEFFHSATFVKENMLQPDEMHYTFAYNERKFEVTILRKEAKITCRKV